MAKAKKPPFDPRDPRAAFDAGVKMLARTPLGGRGVIERLLKKGYDEETAHGAVARLLELHLLKEEASAEAIVHATTRDLPAGEALLRARLEERGVDESASEEALRAAGQSRDERENARTLAAAALRRMPPSVDDATRARRLLGLLARRGFDEETSLEAAREAIPGAFDE